MCTQEMDSCFHRNADHVLSVHAGRRFFDAHDLGFEPVWSSTACYRGYVAHFSILEEELFLTSIDVSLPGEGLRGCVGTGPILFGVPPVSQNGCTFLYEGFRYPIAFSGGMILAEDEIEDEFSSRDFSWTWDYRHVRELIFNAGRVVEEYDRSAAMASLRARVIDLMAHRDESGVKLLRRLNKSFNQCVKYPY